MRRSSSKRRRFSSSLESCRLSRESGLGWATGGGGAGDLPERPPLEVGFGEAFRELSLFLVLKEGFLG